jgi:hypothetical protein
VAGRGHAGERPLEAGHLHATYRILEVK